MYMKDIRTYLNESYDDVDEGLLSDGASALIARNIDASQAREAILNMYDYICDNDDMALFYQDYPLKERILWKNIYSLYSKKAWSIFDAGNVEGLELPVGEFTKVTVPLRRQLRQLIKDSRNSNLELKPGEIDSVITLHDDVKNTNYIITINRAAGLLRRMFRAADKKFLEFFFKKICTGE